MEQLIFENQAMAEEKGFPKFYENAQRQFRLYTGSVIDILTWEIKDEKIFAKIIELKRDCINESAYWQGVEYSIEFLLHIGGYFKDYDIELILVGAEVNYNVSNTTHLHSKVKPIKYSYGFYGVEFEQVGQNYDKVKDMFANFKPSEDTAAVIKILKSPYNAIESGV